jgi:K+-sensing histidine kinase KdpD
MARLESGMVQPRREPTPAADLFRAARENLPLLRPMRIQVADECPDLNVDPSLVLEILVNLIENADRASPAGEAIELHATVHPADSTLARIEILDRGEGLGDAGDTPRRGLGLQIARAFAEAHGGRVELSAREGGGTRAMIDLPAAAMAPS